MATEITLQSARGDIHVLLDPAGDHIVTRYLTDKHGHTFEAMLGHDTDAFDKVVAQAQRGQAFLALEVD